MTLLSAMVWTHGAEARESRPFDTLAGPLPAVVEQRGRPYLVVADIEVPANTVVTIEPGVVLLFKNFTGLHVEGRLVAEGTMLKPIVFTSELDQEHNPASSLIANPYDWNGIYIHKGGLGTSFAHCRVRYSVYGIISDTKFIRVAPALFADNGKSDLVIEGTEHRVGETAYTYVLSTKDATVDGVPVKILRDPLAIRRNVIRYTGLTALLGGCAVGAYRLVQLQDSRERLEALSSTEVRNVTTHSSKEWEKAHRRRNEDIAWSAAAFGLGLLGAVSLTWTFSF
jgi:hypothetical protein